MSLRVDDFHICSFSWIVDEFVTVYTIMEIPDTELAAEMLRDMAYPNVLEVLLRCDVPHEERMAKLDKRRPLAVAAFCKAVAPDRG